MVTLKETTSGISAIRMKRYLKAQAILRKLMIILIREYDVSRIILVGSLLDRNRFGFHSDIDLCVEGLPYNLYFRVVGELQLAAEEFDVDIIPVESVPPKMGEKIKKGKILYEKR
jgi:predicted nucleotidyltransferase